MSKTYGEVFSLSLDMDKLNAIDETVFYKGCKHVQLAFKWYVDGKDLYEEGKVKYYIREL